MPAKYKQFSDRFASSLATVFGWLGWWLGSNFGILAGFVLRGIGSVAGVYIGWRINRDYL